MILFYVHGHGIAGFDVNVEINAVIRTKPFGGTYCCVRLNFDILSDVSCHSDLLIHTMDKPFPENGKASNIACFVSILSNYCSHGYRRTVVLGKLRRSTRSTDERQEWGACDENQVQFALPLAATQTVASNGGFNRRRAHWCQSPREL